MREYTWSEILTLQLKYKDNHEVLELIQTVVELKDAYDLDEDESDD